jgi:hypothetical protein
VVKDAEEYMSTRDFERNFRMSRNALELLLEMITPIIDPHPELSGIRARAANGRRDADSNDNARVTPRMQLMITLRYLAGGSYLDIHARYGVSRSAFLASVDRVLAAIDETLTISFPEFDDLEGLKKLANGFRDASDGHMFEHCVGAVDGYVPQIHCPSVNEVPDPLAYKCYKKFFGVNVQAVCNANYEFTMVSIMCPGRAHDRMAWDYTSLRERIYRNNGALPSPYYLIGDIAYQGAPGILVPNGASGNPKCDPWLDSFDFHLSQLRIK